MAKIIKFNSDDYGLFDKLVEERLAAGEYKEAIKPIKRKLDKITSPTFRELLLRKMHDIYMSVGDFEDAVATLCHIVYKFNYGAGGASVVNAVTMREIASVHGPMTKRCVGEIDCEQLIRYSRNPENLFKAIQKHSGDSSENCNLDDPSANFIVISERRDVRELLSGYGAYAAGNFDRVFACCDSIPPDSSIYDSALILESYAAFASEEYETALIKVLESGALNKESPAYAEMLILSDFELESGSGYEDKRLAEQVKSAINDLICDCIACGNGKRLTFLAETLLYADRYAEGYEVARHAAERAPFYYKANILLAMGAFLTGKREDGVKIVKECREVFPLCVDFNVMEVILAEDDVDNIGEYIKDAYYNDFSDFACDVLSRVRALDFGPLNDDVRGLIKRYLSITIYTDCVDIAEEYFRYYILLDDKFDYSDMLFEALVNPYVGDESKKSILNMLIVCYPSDVREIIVPIRGERALAVKTGGLIEGDLISQSIYARVASNFILGDCADNGNEYVKSLMEKLRELGADKIVGNDNMYCALIHAYSRYCFFEGREYVTLDEIADIYNVFPDELEAFFERFLAVTEAIE